MAAVPTFEKLEDVPEAFRSSYKEIGGKFILDDGETEGLRVTTRKLLDENKKTEAELARLRGVMGDRKPEDVAALLKAHTESEEAREREAGNFDKLLEKRVNETKAEYEKRLEELAPYKQKYEDREVDIAIRDAAAKAGVIPEDMQDVVDLIKGRRVKLDLKTGKPAVYDADGDVTGLSVEKFFAETFKAERPKYYAAGGGSGGGSTGGNGSRQSANGAIIISTAEGKDVMKYRAAKAEAERLKVPFLVQD